mmetsp:Transcript_10578/g.28177  ORF Transcript_10578/g.28177 Transcript_10578/m.28177 type:complete len:114 (-) Transcript_10578:1094-1435(-)
MTVLPDVSSKRFSFRDLAYVSQFSSARAHNTGAHRRDAQHSQQICTQKVAHLRGLHAQICNRTRNFIVGARVPEIQNSIDLIDRARESVVEDQGDEKSFKLLFRSVQLRRYVV